MHFPVYITQNKQWKDKAQTNSLIATHKGREEKGGGGGDKNQTFLNTLFFNFGTVTKFQITTNNYNFKSNH